MSDVEAPRATRAATLTSVGVSAAQPKAGRAAAAAAGGRRADAVGAQSALGPADVPAGLHALVRPTASFRAALAAASLAVFGQHDRQVLQCGRQSRGRADGAVVRHRLGHGPGSESSRPRHRKAAAAARAGRVSAAASAWQASAAQPAVSRSPAASASRTRSGSH